MRIHHAHNTAFKSWDLPVQVPFIWKGTNGLIDWIPALSFLSWKPILENFIHQQIPLIPPMRGTSLPNQNTNHRRMNRDGFRSRFFLRHSAQDLLIAFHCCAPSLFSSRLALLHWIFLWNHCNHRQFVGRLTAGLLPAADWVRACCRAKICVSECALGTQIYFMHAFEFICICACMRLRKRSILGKWGPSRDWIWCIGCGPWRDRGRYLTDYLRWSLDLNWVWVQTHTHTRTHW